MCVLVCEDSQGDFDLLARRLMKIGYAREDIVHARTLEAGRAALATSNCRLAFVDYRLPDGCGLDLLREATAQDWPGPIIVLTGFDDRNADRDALMLGACDFLNKADLKSETIARSIRYATERKRLEALAAKTNSELLHRVRELADAKAEIESMNLRVISLARHLAVPHGDVAEAEAPDPGLGQTLGTWTFDARGRSLSANAATLALLELDQLDDLLDRPVEAVLSGESRGRLLRALPTLDGNAAMTLEVEAIGQSTGAHRALVMSLVARPAAGESAEPSYAATVVDVTSRRNVESTYRYLARHDPLTGLANRAAFKERLDHDAAVARRNNSLVALICIDLDNFKEVNDTYGHLAGDTLLRAVAKRLTDSARQSDTVARLGGDEFAIVATNIVNASGAERIVAKLERSFEHPFSIGGKQIYCGASVGYSLYPSATEDLEALFEFSDAALYRKKRSRAASYRA